MSASYLVLAILHDSLSNSLGELVSDIRSRIRQKLLRREAVGR